MFYIYEDVILSTKNLEMIGKTAMQCNFLCHVCAGFFKVIFHMNKSKVLTTK